MTNLSNCIGGNITQSFLDANEIDLASRITNLEQVPIVASGSGYQGRHNVGGEHSKLNVFPSISQMQDQLIPPPPPQPDFGVGLTGTISNDEFVTLGILPRNKRGRKPKPKVIKQKPMKMHEQHQKTGDKKTSNANRAWLNRQRIKLEKLQMESDNKALKAENEALKVNIHKVQLEKDEWLKLKTNLETVNEEYKSKLNSLTMVFSGAQGNQPTEAIFPNVINLGNGDISTGTSSFMQDIDSFLEYNDIQI